MDKNRIYLDLLDLNPWWRGALPEEATWPKRTAFSHLKNCLFDKFIHSLVGLRRTGKTTLIKQLIAYLSTEKKVPPFHLCYFFFDEEMGKIDGFLSLLLETYLEKVIKTTKGSLQNPVYFFLDEIQYLDKWQVVLKRFVDTSDKFKFFISGSASLEIKSRALESLAGRIFEEKIYPLSFFEFLLLKNHQLAGLSIWKKRLALESFDYSFWEEKIEETKPYFNLLENLYQEHLVSGQFPELINITDSFKIRKYLEEAILGKIIKKDLPFYLGLEKTEELEKIFRILSAETGNLLEYGNIASEIGLSQITTHKYLWGFGETFLSHIIYNYQKGVRIPKRQLKKHYIASTNFSCSTLAINQYHLNFKNLVGHLVETSVFNSLLKFSVPISFWRRREKEVDFLLNFPDKIIPLEVKYSLKVDKEAIGTLSSLVEKLKMPYGFYLSKNLIGKKEKIFFLPIWLI